MFTSKLLSALFGAATLAVASPAFALTLFEIADTGGNSGNCRFQCVNALNYGAENFSLASDATATTLTFVTRNQPGWDAASTVVTWSIRSDLSGLPGSVLAGGDLTPTAASLGVRSSLEAVRYRIDIPDTALSAGNYWATFHLATTGGGYVYWLRSSEGDLLSAHSADGGDTWVSGYATLSGEARGFVFSVESAPSDVPLPAAAPLLIASLGGLAVLRRRRRS